MPCSAYISSDELGRKTKKKAEMPDVMIIYLAFLLIFLLYLLRKTHFLIIVTLKSQR
jgi:hypothetical protein